MIYQPLTPTCTHHHILLINSRASVLDLHAYGSERLRAGKDIIDSLSCMNLGKIDDEDLAHLIQGAALLLRDGYDIWKVIEVRALEADRQGSLSAGMA
ncbi:hypothetical protein NLK61_07050 [Pseudomonas fuscovaginae UPB0736]|uniref:Uncharacterized protein n=1 Tax=Pseudomonas asplenii TaxID=53407 RepID=A0A1H1NK62_9PSED|nr:MULTISPECIES: hypothetical protein [Pseudomonas]UUQ66394.1 hypothetical protein NLK61_07050 [Pseudomonas fuscovaginae UPB0736]SDR99250.1 hypothetical protein SAMN05216598_0171 [Pseudomonas asplenii]